MAKAFKKAGGRCKFTISNEEIGRILPFIWSFSKTWRYTDAFNYKLLKKWIIPLLTKLVFVLNSEHFFRMRWLSETGIVNYMLKRSTPNVDSCRLGNQKPLKNDENDSRKVLSLHNLSGPFILLVFGSSLSLLVFLMEKIYYKFKLHYSRGNIITV